jgi:hypothetical protein
VHPYYYLFHLFVEISDKYHLNNIFVGINTSPPCFDDQLPLHILPWDPSGCCLSASSLHPEHSPIAEVGGEWTGKDDLFGGANRWLRQRGERRSRRTSKKDLGDMIRYWRRGLQSAT